jgi:hydroxymethylpyrimidine pyrophosphatase-like HAD family hydrolase
MGVLFRAFSSPLFGNEKASDDFSQKIALFSDIDYSVMDWTPTDGYSYNFPAVQKLSRVLHQDEFKNSMLRGLTSGRGLKSFKNIAEQLAVLPALHMVALNDGQMLFVNKNHLPTKPWIQSLTVDQQDSEWSDYLKREKNWAFKPVTETVQAVLNEEGYWRHPNARSRQSEDEPNRSISYRPMTQEEIKASFKNPEELKARGEKPIVVLARYPDQSYFEVRIENTSLPADVDPVSQALADKIIESLKNKGVKAEGYAYSVQNHGPAFTPQNNDPLKYNHAYIHFGPEGIEKSSTIQNFIRNRMGSLEAFITAGDSRNDYQMLSLDSVLIPKAGKSALNYPVRLGERPVLDALTGLPRLISMPIGSLADGIIKQWEKIKQSLTGALEEPENRFRKVA